MVEDGVGELGWGFFRGWGRGDETNYCPFDITRKDVFCLFFFFILNENILF